MNEEVYCTELDEWVDVNEWCRYCSLRTIKSLGVSCAYESDINQRRIRNEQSHSS